MANNKEDEKLHIVMFPWLAFGHMIPWLELAKLIAQKGHKISFISTPRNIDRLPKLSPNLSHLIHFVKIPLCHVDNLPENAEATSDVPYNKVQYLKKAYDLLEEPMTRILQSLDPDWVFYDFAPYWLGPTATRLGVKSVFFSIFIGAFLSFLGPPSVLVGEDDRTRKSPEDFTIPAQWVPFQTNVAYRYFEVKAIFDSVTGDASGVTDLYRIGLVARHCDIVAIRSCSEFEPEWIQVLETIYEKPVFPVGQLPTTAHTAEDETDTWRWIKEWLDKQKRGSVVYVAFGSEAKPSQSQLTELALGLELSEIPFFWVLRTRRGLEDDEIIQLPDGFVERTKERGVVWTSWAPQVNILAHDSVGGFLTHSGWSSVVEALQFERALILLPFLADQGINARVLEEKQIGYSIPRSERDGSFMRDSVAESLKLVMVKEAGQIYREKAKEMRRLFADRDRQYRYVDNFLGYLIKQTVRKTGGCSPCHGP